LLTIVPAYMELFSICLRKQILVSFSFSKCLSVSRYSVSCWSFNVSFLVTLRKVNSQFAIGNTCPLKKDANNTHSSSTLFTQIQKSDNFFLQKKTQINIKLLFQRQWNLLPLYLAFQYFTILQNMPAIIQRIIVVIKCY
jgi:hypothetical protein